MRADRAADFRWDAENIEWLRQLWAWRDDAGGCLSTAEIGRHMGCSKNSVVGKAHRLELPGRPSPINLGGKAGPEPRARPVRDAHTLPPLASTASATTVYVAPRVVAARAVSVQPPPSPVIAVAVSRPCCWPLWGDERPTHRYCEARGAPGKPYCAAHMDKATAKPREVPRSIRQVHRMVNAP